MQEFQEQMLLHRALAFAAQAHRGQLRKGSPVPYLVHPCEVAQILAENNCPTRLAIAGLLHDTLEDTSTTAGEIAAQFGPETLHLVQACSEDKSQSWEQRKQHTIYQLRLGQDLDFMLLTCADKLSNLRSMQEDYAQLGEALWSRFHRGRQQQAWYYQNICQALEVLGAYPMAQELQARCALLFAPEVK